MKRQGFTLIEMLVTFWILSFLTTLFLPSITKARDTAKAP
ncbi:MAG: prepilin-type N-terminal cleavage/methylation domain-containing protein [Phycisphaerales bacterium]|nr:prepilin-type N-terminal cleavage/methylation domain-containing protein [Phycisphaerales bacterium]